jgi:hypothetical protein
MYSVRQFWIQVRKFPLRFAVGRRSLGGAGRPVIISDAFSAIMRTAALVLADGIVGMIEASTTRKLSTP